jgi:hypothetical protein
MFSKFEIMPCKLHTRCYKLYLQRKKQLEKILAEEQQEILDIEKRRVEFAKHLKKLQPTL